MPIGTIAGIGNFVVNLFSKSFKLIMEKPQYLFIMILILLFFPLEFVDFLLYLIVNIFIVIINAVILLLVMIINSIIWLINGIYSLIIGAINWGVQIVANSINWVIAKILAPINWIIWAINQIPPGFNIPTFGPYTFNFAPFSTTLLNEVSYSLTLSYYDINIFGTVGSGAWFAVLLSKDITCLFDVIGVASPIW